MDEICAGAREAGLKVHMDGARVFNAAEALGVPVDRITRNVDTVMFCLSKGLGAPVGSMLAGRRDDMARARLYRKRLGGGMRQAGVLAAAGLIALEKHPKLLARDHENARFLAEGLSRIAGISVDMGTVQSNIVMCDVSGTGQTSAEFSKRLKEQGVLANSVLENRLRLVTHYDVDRVACQRALEVTAEIASGMRVAAHR
jgi:threonine aldolase